MWWTKHFDEDELDRPQQVEVKRQMGPEWFESWENDLFCDQSGNEIEFEYQVHEYPVGI
jgi:hypothetical protein